jgi:hypothetical protein
MAGLYDWEKRADGTQTCDMLEVYSSGEREKLKQTVNSKVLKHIITVNNTFEGNVNGTEFIFSESLASIDDERAGSSGSGSEDGDGDEDKDILLAAERMYPTKKPLLVVRETVSEVMDMMRINVDDI